ncbi:CvpA family protein [Aeoliella sp. ICT_H6.2]|uniref:CvpA family protein n=1 Tax=Aeoliella straminimaris TaxID=2954799 RepID=A0A9X2JJ30_9BACT|nr:CvpA family protein [Aeoliella straminimaris]MCO6047725.1 CvpA family protein [Aeoliella straminimaris]
MQTYDLLMLVVLVGATLFGFVKGMAWQVAYLASLIVSYFAAVKFSPQLAPMFGETEPFNRFAAMLAVYVATSLAIWLIFRGVAGAIDRVKLNEFDRQMGALIGFARGVLWCIGITFFAAMLLESQRSAILNSKAGHYIGVLLAKSDAVFPPEVQKVVGPYVDRIEKELDKEQPAGSGWSVSSDWPQGGQGGQGASWPSGSQSAQPAQQPAAGAPASGGTTPWPSSGTSSPPANSWPSSATNPTPWPNQ